MAHRRRKDSWSKEDKSGNNDDLFPFDPSIDVPSRKSISDRRLKNNRRNKALDLGLRAPSNKHDSYRVSDTSYTRQNIKIDHHGIKSSEDDEQKTATPSQESFIKDISDIQILGALGSGQSGYVSQAIHIPTQRIIAVKTISVYEKSQRNQIMNEFRALTNVNCKGLVDFYGIFFSKGSVLIALEYMHCGSLLDVLKKVSIIPEPILAVLAGEILNGLDILHTKKKGMVHRDLKPANICLNANGEAKVTDFGISRELKDSIGKCRSYVGTYTYMSPERIRAEPYNAKSDIWGFGITLMECAIGKFPYIDLVDDMFNYLEMLQTIAMEPPPKLPKDMKFSKEFEDFLYLCICKDPTKRPSANELKKHKWIQMHSKKVNNADIKQWIKKNDLIIKVNQK